MPQGVLVRWIVVALLAAFGGPVLGGQSLGEVVRQQKKDKQKHADSAPDTAKPKKVYTNEDVATSRGDSQNQQGEKADPFAGPRNSNAPAGSDDKTDSAPPLKASSDTASIKVKFPSDRVKRPSYTQLDWMAQNTSDHSEKLTMTTVATGPCNFHKEDSSNFELTAGQGLTTNLVTFGVEATNCAGVYTVELRLSSAGKVLSTALASVTVE